jgi:ribosomal protein S18 acetylase RimI-like enzyme
VVVYRSFRNDDAPGLTEIWNEAFTGRGAVILRNSSPLERHVFSKPYFDPEGLMLALDGSRRIGFAHAGFGPNASETALSYATGVLCAIGVRPSFQRQGIGLELLSRIEAYAKRRGSRTIIAGPLRPLEPFYFGLYGGTGLPGYLASDPAASAFLEGHGYAPLDTCLVMHRQLDQPLGIADGRFPPIRRRYALKPCPRSGVGSWWQECVMATIEPVEFRLEDAHNGRLAARAEMWEMEGFSWRWGLPAVGLLDLKVDEGHRRQGLGKFLLTSILQYLQEQYFGLVEAQVMERNQAAVKLLQSVGFEQVDVGRSYRAERGAEPGR